MCGMVTAAASAHGGTSMLRISARVVVLAVLAASWACSSPTESSNIPQVAGNYSGSGTLTFPELQTSITCPASTTVTQSGTTVNIAPIILAGQCGTSIPLGQGTINATGALDGGSDSGTYNEPSCGTYNYTASGGFFGRELRISMSATSSTCVNFNFTMVLSR